MGARQITSLGTVLRKTFAGTPARRGSQGHQCAERPAIVSLAILQSDGTAACAAAQCIDASGGLRRALALRHSSSPQNSCRGVKLPRQSPPQCDTVRCPCWTNQLLILISSKNRLAVSAFLYVGGGQRHWQSARSSFSNLPVRLVLAAPAWLRQLGSYSTP